MEDILTWWKQEHSGLLYWVTRQVGDYNVLTLIWCSYNACLILLGQLQIKQNLYGM